MLTLRRITRHLPQLAARLAHYLACPLAALGLLLLAMAGAAQAQSTFTYTAPGGPQTYTVPPGVTRLQVVATGAGGGSGNQQANPSYGARVQATLLVTPGETLTIQVGGQGSAGASGLSSSAGGYNGGGTGYTCGGGGGATSLQRALATPTDDYLTTRNALVVAAGGGGSSFIGSAVGGNGGVPVGGMGAGDAPGQGATQAQPGAGGGGGENGAANMGGAGRMPTISGGGGGGGYYGGGGGGVGGGRGGSGGGGSSWATAGASSVSYAVASAAGNGALTLTPLYTAPVITSLSAASGAVGSSLTLTGTDLGGATSVRFGELAAPLGSYTVNAAGTQLTVTVPVLAASNAVSVTTPGGVAVSPARFLVTRASSSGAFTSLGNLQAGGTTIKVSVFCAPTVTDLDGNGRLDLLVGNYSGTVARYEQTSAGATTFTSRGDLQAGGAPLSVGDGNNATPTVTDLDGNGLLDLLVGTNIGTVTRYEQTGAGATTFTSLGYLQAGGTVLRSFYAAPTVTDLDGNGQLDLLVGNNGGFVARYEQNLSPTLTSLSPGSGPLGTILTLTGSNLTGLSSVLVGGVPAALTVQSATQATATVPRQAVSQRVRASSAAGTGLSPAAFQVTRPSSSLVLPGGASLTTDGSTALIVSNFDAPTVTDLDGDGLLDLLAGNDNGQVQRYEQTQANGGVFAGGANLTTDGSTLLDVGSLAVPTVTDVDGDGLLDLLVGNDSGNVQRYEQTTANGGVFALVGSLTTDGSTALNVGTYAAPTVTDVDGDGLLDLLVGNYTGQVQRYEQTQANGGVFAGGTPLTTDGSTLLDVGIFARPTATDLDGDGLLDLLVGNADGIVQRYEQTTANGGVFAGGANLTTDGSASLDVGNSATPTVTDVDGDGLLDLLVGSFDGFVQRYEQSLPLTLTSLSPGSGPLGTTLTLTGTNLTGLTSVLVGGVPAAGFTVQSATQATAVVPRQAVSQRVRASSAIGTDLSASTFQVTRPSASLVLPGGTRLTTNGSTTLDVGNYATPAVTDLDGDGLLDLLVGNDTGNVRRYEQTAADGTAFAGGTLLTTNGSTALDVGNYAAPAVTDLDGDGLLDLLVGNNAGNVQRYEQTTVNGDVFAPLGNLTTDGSTSLDVGAYAAPTVTDLDGDGLLDLLAGNNDGLVQHYEQTQANGSVFAPLGNLTTDGSTALDVGLYATPTVTDLDGDGLLDLLAGNDDGLVQRYEQTQANGSVFAPLGNLTTDGSTTLDVGFSSAPTVTDVDGDGLLDLLLGGRDGQVQRYEQAPVPAVTALSVAAELPGQPVVLTGTGFLPTSTVRFGGTAAASVSYTSATSLTAVVPVGATPGSSAVTVGSYDVASPAASSPAFEVLQVYRNATATASGCLGTDPLAMPGTGGPGRWRYLRLPAAQGGGVVAAIEDTRDLGTVTARVLALGTATTQPVRTDDTPSRRAYLDRNFALTSTTALGPGNSVQVRFFGLTSELTRLTQADPAATAATLKLSQYSGPNEDCELANNGTPTDERVLPAPATTLSGADWFTAEATVTSHFSEFYLTGASTPLPVQLVQFAATASGPATVRLSWTTASEVNSARFEVQRSPDGRAWATIGTVAAAGSSASLRTYAYLDGAAPAGTGYYRLRQVDQDGRSAYSPVRSVQLEAGGLSLYPNPAPGGAATLLGATPGQAIQVLDTLGRVAATATADAAGTAALGGLAPGLYVVRAGTNSVRLTVE